MGAGCFSLDPSSVRAREGMERVEKHNEMGMEGGYDVEVEDMAASDNEVGTMCVLACIALCHVLLFQSLTVLSLHYICP